MADELDSYLYQSVGTSLVTLIAKALRLPLYQKTITGKPVHLDSTYGSRTKDRGSTQNKKDGIAGDETEDLDELLHRVKVRIGGNKTCLGNNTKFCMT